MPDRIVELDGVQHHFPSDATDAEIAAALQGAPPKWNQPGGDILLDNARSMARGIVSGLNPLNAIAGMAKTAGALADPLGTGNAVRQAIKGFDPKVLTDPQANIDVPNLAGQAIGGMALGEGVNLLQKGAAKAAPWLMQKALKPNTSLLKEYKTTPTVLAKTLLDEGVNVTEHGITKLQTLLDATNDEIRSAVQAAPGLIDKKTVAANALPTAAKIAQQVNPTKDLQAVGDTVGEFLNHPVMTGPTLTVPEAQAMKIGTYQQIGKKYGEVSSAGIETQKALARGLKEQIASEVPGISALNQRDSELMAALDATGRRVAVAGNRDPVGFAWVAQHPTAFLAALFDRSPLVKSLVARGLWGYAGQAAKVDPALVKAAVVALTTAGSADGPAPGSAGTTPNP